MKLQISFDLDDLKKAIDIAKKVEQFADILEIGTSLIIKYGIGAIESFRENFPKATLLADTKIVDQPKDIATIISNAGADWLTVMAGTTKEVIHLANSNIHELNKKSMLDITDATSPGQSALEAKSLGADAILFNQTYDLSQPLVILDKWEMVRGNTNLPIFISGKITRENIGNILELKPEGIAIGKAIVNSLDPENEAKYFHDLIS